MSDKEEKKKEDKNSKKDDEDIGEVSYTYWKRESDIKADHKGFQPQATATPVNINQNTNSAGSAWNKAGTWEEKTVTKKMFEDFFNDYIKKNEKKYKNVFIFDEVFGYSGEVSHKYLLFNINYLYRHILFLREEKLNFFMIAR